MEKQKFKKILKEIKRMVDDGEDELANDFAGTIIEDLYKERDFPKIAEIFENQWFGTRNVPAFTSFEVAYALSELGETSEAEKIYESLLKENSDNTSVLNNLAIIKEKKWELKKALQYIKKAEKLSWKADEVISRNFKRISDNHEKYSGISETLGKENDYVISKLRYFIANFKKEPVFRNGWTSLANWKFKVLIGADEERAKSLKDQWLSKNYLIDTGDRNELGSHCYKLNPFLEELLARLITTTINPRWSAGIEALNVTELKKLDYFDIKKKLEKANKKYSWLLQRDFDELVVNYLMKNRKTVIVLSGSFLELLFTYWCEKKKHDKVIYSQWNRQVVKNLYDSTLWDFLEFFEQSGFFDDSVLHIGQMSRIYRNFVHPWKEIKQEETLDDTKMELCMHAVLSITKTLT